MQGSQQQQVWDVLRAQKSITKQELLSALPKIAKEHIVAYIIALRKANYVQTTHAGHGHAIQDITLIEDAGEDAPIFNRGLVKDATKVTKVYNVKVRETEHIDTLYVPILEAIVALGQEEIRVAELCAKLTELKHNDIEYKSSFTRRWLDRLEDQKVITCTGSYRNSKIYLVNLAQIKALRENI